MRPTAKADTSKWVYHRRYLWSSERGVTTIYDLPTRATGWPNYTNLMPHYGIISPHTTQSVCCSSTVVRCWFVTTSTHSHSCIMVHIINLSMSFVEILFEVLLTENWIHSLKLSSSSSTLLNINPFPMPSTPLLNCSLGLHGCLFLSPCLIHR